MDRDSERDFRDFVLVAYQRLTRTAYLLCGDRHEAEDLVQTALARAALAWHRLDAGPDAYVRKILVNVFRSSRRRHWRQEIPVQAVPDRGLADAASTTDDRDFLRRALAELPPRQRAAVVLRFYEDLSEQQTAAVLGCSVGTVKSLTSRGLQRLRRDLPAEKSHAQPAEVDR
ncbi:SigE family RNA polymerase sigma factor [Dactylosporangium sp. NPDC051484]|uniref:SigE family RNA polymerase sigma factor n=1 Tax=Dactylosporangium sp. NPDC051484 TaxID=3154942 RepID=UPI00344E232E